MVTMIWCIENVCVIQLAQGGQFAVYPLYWIVDTLQSLQSFRHKDVGETLVDWFHLAEPAKDPLFVGIRREIVGRCPMPGHIEEHVGILRSWILGTVRSRVTHDQQERLIVVILLRLTQETNRIVSY